MKALALLLFSILVLAGCGGGGSSSNRAPEPEPAAVASGSLTVTLGDAALDGIDAVIIDIEEVLLLGEDGQISLTDGPINDVNLLNLQYITTLIADTEVPAGDYSKIRLMISSLQIVETDDPDNPVEARLPANGKIDLNPQGEFNIAPGENLVVQIDIDLARSIKIVETGNGGYRFRPVVFIDVLDQGDVLRLSKLFGNLQADNDADGDDIIGDESDYDLCTENNMDPCVDVNLAESALLLDAEGNSITPEDFLLPEDATVFGHYVVTAGGDFFRAAVVVFGDELSVRSIEGDVASAVEADAFTLTVEEVDTNVLVGDALILDRFGNPLGFDIAPGQEAEAWAQVAQIGMPTENDFPAFLVQVREADESEEDSVEGILVDITDSTLTLLNESVESCVLIDDETEYRLLSEYNSDAATDVISFIALGDLFEGPNDIEIEAFGTLVEDCLEADVVSAEIE